MKKERESNCEQGYFCKTAAWKSEKAFDLHSMLMTFHKSTGTPPDLISNVSLSSIVCMIIEHILKNK